MHHIPSYEQSTNDSCCYGTNDGHDDDDNDDDLIKDVQWKYDGTGLHIQVVKREACIIWHSIVSVDFKMM